MSASGKRQRSPYSSHRQSPLDAGSISRRNTSVHRHDQVGVAERDQCKRRRVLLCDHLAPYGAEQLAEFDGVIISEAGLREFADEALSDRGDVLTENRRSGADHQCGATTSELADEVQVRQRNR